LLKIGRKGTLRVTNTPFGGQKISWRPRRGHRKRRSLRCRLTEKSTGEYKSCLSFAGFCLSIRVPLEELHVGTETLKFINGTKHSVVEFFSAGLSREPFPGSATRTRELSGHLGTVGPTARLPSFPKFNKSHMRFSLLPVSWLGKSTVVPRARFSVQSHVPAAFPCFHGLSRNKAIHGGEFDRSLR